MANDVGVRMTPVMKDALLNAKNALVARNTDFRADHGAKDKYSSPTAKQAIRDFERAVTSGAPIDWEGYRAVYDNHRALAGSGFPSLLLYIKPSGIQSIQAIRSWVESDQKIFRVVAMDVNSFGPRIPSTEIIIFSLLFAAREVQTGA